MKTTRLTTWLVAVVAATLTRAAAFPPDVAGLMDTRVDPREDLYQYACGAWLANTTVPSDRASYARSFNAVSDRSERVLQEIAEQHPPLVGAFWDACMATDELTALGNKPLQPQLTLIAEAATTRELMRVAAAVGVAGPDMLVSINVGADARDATKNVLYASNGDLVLPAASYYLDNATFGGVEAAYRQYIRTLLRLAGIVAGNGSDADQAENAVVAMEKQVAAITPPHEQARDLTASYHPLPYREAATAYPLAFGVLGDSLGLLQRSALTADDKIVLRSLAYFEAAETLLANSKLSDLRLYLAFLYVHYYAAYLGEPFQAARFELFGEKLSGLTSRAPRSRVCTRALMTSLPDVVGAHYASKMLDRQRLEQVEAMVAAIEGALRERLASLDWLDETTRARAQNKLERVVNLVGQSTTARRQYLSEPSRDDYMGNVVALTTTAFNVTLQKLAQAVDRTEWPISPAEVNAFYSATQNKMVLPAAILQPPFYDSGAHAAQNFGALGAVIGHELTHGFDNNGRKYDGDGTLREWWTRATAAQFEARAQCLRSQYSAFEVVGENGDMLGYADGNATLSENIADNGGVGLALAAFRRSRGGVADGGSDERLFFVAFAQMWCTRTRDAAQRQQLLTREPHAPARWRVNGVARNSEAFARAFQCRSSAAKNLSTSTTCMGVW